MTLQKHSRINSNYSGKRKEVDSSPVLLPAWLWLPGEVLAAADAVTQTNLYLGWTTLLAWMEEKSRTRCLMEQSTSATQSCIHT